MDVDHDPALAIEARALTKTYAGRPALDGFDLAVPAGTVCGLLGPNGAGKTTAVRILTTLVSADAGYAVVAGHDVGHHPDRVRARIGLSGQEPAVDEILSGRQNLVLFARLAGFGRRDAGRRADELLDQMDLVEAAETSVKRYSGGMRRRLDLAVTLIQAPPVLFLDEPTTGLDPRNRSEVWNAIRGLVAGGTTVLLTTQYLDEADQLADQIVLIESGRAIAGGTPGELKAQAGGDQLEVVVTDSADLPRATEVLRRVAGADPDVDVITHSLRVPVLQRVAALTEALAQLGDAGVVVADVGLRRPTLDDVFLRLTGRRTSPATPTETGTPTDTRTTTKGEVAA